MTAKAPIPQADMDPLLTIPEAAKKLGGVAQKTLRRVAEDNDLLIKFGRTPMVEASALPKIIDLCRVKKTRRAYTSAPQGEASRAGISDTADANTPQAALKATLAALSER